MNTILSLKNFFLAVAFISIFTLVGAVYIEFILGAKPCKLCVYQRFPYIIAIFICYFGYTNLKQNGLIRHVISKVWNKGQHRITQVFEYESQDSFKNLKVF